MSEPVTIWGRASTIRGLACERSATGRIIGGHSYDDLALELPDDGVPVDLDHDGEPLGRLIYGEIAKGGGVDVVAVLDNDRIQQVEHDVFFSPLLMMIGDGVNERSYIARRARAARARADPLPADALRATSALANRRRPRATGHLHMAGLVANRDAAARTMRRLPPRGPARREPLQHPAHRPTPRRRLPLAEGGRPTRTATAKGRARARPTRPHSQRSLTEGSSDAR